MDAKQARKPRVVRTPEERRKEKIAKLDWMREQILFKRIQNKTREYRKSGDAQLETELLSLMDEYAEAVERNNA